MKTKFRKVFTLLLITFAVSSYSTIEVNPELYQPVNVSHSVWPNFVTKTIRGEVIKAICNAVFFEDSGQETVCHLSSIHQWRITQELAKLVYMKHDAIGLAAQNENGIVNVPKITQINLRTHMDEGSDGDSDCWLYLKVCLEDETTCCDSDVFDDVGDDYERGNLDTYGSQTGLGPCYNFEVLDFRTAHIYMRHTGSDDWGGEYVNLWFEDNSWLIRCVHPDGSGKIYLDGIAILELECLPGDINNP